MNPAYLEDPDLAATTFGDLFAELHARGDLPPVPVGPTLQRHFDGYGTVPSRRKLPIGRGPLIGLAVAGTVAGGLGAAAANELPRPLQRAVSTVVNTVTPFTIATGTEQEPAEAPASPVASVSPFTPHGGSADADEDENSSVDESGSDDARSGAEPGDSDDGEEVNDSDSGSDGSDDTEAEQSMSEDSDGGSASDDTEVNTSSSDDSSSSDDGGSSDDSSDSD